MLEHLEKIKKECLGKIKEAKNVHQLEEIYFRYLGRKGELTNILRALKDFSLEEKRKIGPVAQKLKKELEEVLEEKKKFFVEQASFSLVDLTAPGRRIIRGHLHPLSLVEREIRQIFKGMNFSVVDGPEVESEYYNFDALNIPPNHPAREMWDTFWLKIDADNSKDKREKNDFDRSKMDSRRLSLLRTHTSPVQIRYMEVHHPPFQIIVPGRVFRYEATDASHEINFYQVEGLVVGKEINLANFKFVVEEFLKKFFAGRKIEFRYRPSYFPFVEPGLEVDIKLEGGKRDKQWLEIMGAGMVHPRVFEYAHYNPREWQGFAFGVGLDRLAMIKYKIPDIRLFYSGDLRFVRQF